jgi:hypothetical protein
MVVVVTVAVGLVAGGMNEAGVLVDSNPTVMMLVGMKLDLIAARIARMGTHNRDQSCDDGADERQKDDCLDHWRASSRMIAAQTRLAFVAKENRFPLCANAALRFRIMP